MPWSVRDQEPGITRALPDLPVQTPQKGRTVSLRRHAQRIAVTPTHLSLQTSPPQTPGGATGATQMQHRDVPPSTIS